MPVLHGFSHEGMRQGLADMLLSALQTGMEPSQPLDLYSVLYPAHNEKPRNLLTLVQPPHGLAGVSM